MAPRSGTVRATPPCQSSVIIGKPATRFNACSHEAGVRAASAVKRALLVLLAILTLELQRPS
jgi:hypothetical protein